MKAVVAIAIVASVGAASGDPLRLRADALATAQAPAGLLVLEAGDRATSWLDAEASVWTGTDDDGADADALVMVIELRDPDRRGALRIGRHVVFAGGLRPVHLDGVSARVKLPSRFAVEAFGGLPVAPGFGPQPWDWVVGGRLARPIGAAQLGLAWVERREHGALHTHEVALDGAAVIGGADLAAAATWDLIGGGLAEARVSVAKRRRGLRGELFATHRSPSHLLPATSLFSVLGDVPARLAGADVRWRAAPRLDVGGSAGVRLVDGEAGEDLALRTTLRLDPRGDGAVGFELRREGAADGGWTGLRGFARVPMGGAWTASSEVELAIADQPARRGAAWPWGLVAIGWRPAAWELAAAVEASASPEQRRRVDGLLRVTRRWGAP